MNALNLIKEVAETIDTIGQEATITALKSARDSCIKPKLVKGIFEIVSKEIGFNINSANDLKRNTDERKAIIGLVCFFSYKKLRVNYLDMEVVCIKTKQMLSYYKGVIENCNRKKPISELEKIVAEHYQNINDKVNELLKNK